MTTEPTFASAPIRSTIAFTLSFGMIPVRMRLFAPTEDPKDAVTPHQYVEVTDDKGVVTNHPVGRLEYNKDTGKPVNKADIVKKVEVSNPNLTDGPSHLLVELTDDEKALVTAGSAVDRGDVPIECFVPLSDLHDRYKVKSSYQIRPALRQEERKSVPDPQADKAFALFIAAMGHRDVGCLIRIGLRTTARYALITPDGFMHMLHFDAEIREPYPFPAIDVSEANAKAAGGLIDGYGVDTPNLVDESTEALVKYLTNKAKTGEVIEVPEVTETDEATPDLDFTALIAASIDVVKAAKKAKVDA